MMKGWTVLAWGYIYTTQLATLLTVQQQKKETKQSVEEIIISSIALPLENPEKVEF